MKKNIATFIVIQAIFVMMVFITVTINQAIQYSAWGQLASHQQESIKSPIREKLSLGSACKLNLDLVTLKAVQFVIPPQTLASKNNNPFNLRYVGQYQALPGVKGFAKFRTIKEGVLAGYRQIERDAYREHTIGSFIYKYAPPTENDTDNYIKFITNGLNCRPDTLLINVDRFNLGLLMMRMECGARMVYNDN